MIERELIYLNGTHAAAVTTEHKIEEITYFVCSSFSERAKDTLDKKIKKGIRKDLENNAGNRAFSFIVALAAVPL